ncbi:signal recognition particle-docking protein FtsY [Enterococcus dongliensis]|uniref:signal recognition particle-docking protein FtsY n=1 Tax=Enterococcus dongliensis TaxID=2559925 RepID=UPI0028905575|nr:signal recognition particle-docking protein FtsY [Enterococcus dongliensis]MDT2640015.1 signal recognition particle-docking protein FtsY [Enterococcus dongliensis]MDT2668056.1 signal recognition particle-docking protein FtsY [Enterococcus dongliensis]MDT2702410.1 signal recognition particle-docking protein FtsY [Enterococcus dongliensis]
MGLFDRIKKAFTGEKEAEKPEEVIEDQENSEVDADKGIETIDTEQTPEAEQAPETEKEASPSEKTEKMTDLVEDTVEQQPEEATDLPVQEVEPESIESAQTSAELEEAEQATESLAEETELPEISPSEAAISPEPVEEPIEETVQEKYDKGLEKTRKSFGERMNELFARFRRVDEDFFEELEETLIGADVGFDTAIKLTDSLRQEVKLKNAKKPAQIQNVIIEKLVDIYEAEGINENNAINLQSDGLSVILFVGVNGTGKTTSIGKLAKQYKDDGKKVLLAAADTFRAGAIDQLVVWGERSGVEVVRGNAGGDPAAVVFDAVDKAKNENYDILLIDTAGRLQNKVNLMNELEKIKRVIQREFPTAPHEVLLVVDATTGQNALVQARQFKETTDVTGLVLTKLDGTAKGGIVLAIRNELHLPVKLVGLGEGINDLEVFDSNDFAVGLFKGLLKEE